MIMNYNDKERKIMLIDTQRIEDFLKTHSCHIINEEKTLEDKVTYPDFATNRYESVFKQLQTDIEVEKAYDALEDVLFVENKDGDLVLAGPYEFTINEKIYSYEAGTPREPIWEDMFKLHSQGAEFTYSTEYEDTSFENGNDKTMPEADRSELVGLLIDTVEDSLESKGITKKDITNDENEKYNTKVLLSQAEYIGREDIEHKLESGEECDEDMTSTLYFRLPKDNPYIAEAYEKETVEAAKEVGLKIIFPYKKLNPALGEAYLTADVDGDAFKLDTLINLKPEDISKLITNSYIKNFCNGDIAIKINSQKEFDELIKTIQDDVNCNFWNYSNHYNDEFPYYFVNSANALDSVEKMEYISEKYRCLKNNRFAVTECIDFKDINFNAMDLNNNEELDNDIELEER